MGLRTPESYSDGLQGARHEKSMEGIEGVVIAALVANPKGLLPQLLEFCGFHGLSQKQVLSMLLSWLRPSLRCYS